MKYDGKYNKKKIEIWLQQRQGNYVNWVEEVGRDSHHFFVTLNDPDTGGNACAASRDVPKQETCGPKRVLPIYGYIPAESRRRVTAGGSTSKIIHTFSTRRKAHQPEFTTFP